MNQSEATTMTMLSSVYKADAAWPVDPKAPGRTDIKSVIPFKVILPKPPPLTPNWLLKNGFEYYHPTAEPPSFDVDFKKTDTVLLETGIHRNQFCVVMTPQQYSDGEVWFDTAIWMQHNIGCGFDQIPDCNITEWTIERFEMLYFALRGYHSKNHPE